MRAVIALLLLAGEGLAFAAPERGAVFVIEGLNVAPEVERSAEGRFRHHLGRTFALTLVAETLRMDRACLDDSSCITSAAAPHQIDHVLGVQTGTLGDTTLIKVSHYDAKRGVRRGAWQAVCAQLEPACLDSSLARIVAGIDLPRAKKPWHRRWWVWTTVGAVAVAAVAVGVGVGLGTRGDDNAVDLPLPSP